MDRFLNSRGSSHIANLLYLLIITLVIYIVVKIVPPYMNYYAMEDEVRQQIQLAQMNPADMIINDIYLKAQELEIPLEKEDINLERDDAGKFSIDFSWTQDVDFGYGVRKSFSFEINQGAAQTGEE